MIKFKPDKNLQDVINYIIFHLKQYNSSYHKSIYINNKEWFIRPEIQFNSNKRIISVYDKYGIVDGSTYIKTIYSIPIIQISVSNNLLNNPYELCAEVYYKLYNLK